MFKDPTLLIRLVAVWLFALAGTAVVLVSSYEFIVSGNLPPQLFTILTGILGASFTLMGFHSNTLASTLVHYAKEGVVKIEKENAN